jgi:hypothetical protein
LCATTVFLALNVLWQPRTSSYVVRAVLQRKAPGAGSAGRATASVDLERIRAELTSDDALAAALATAGLPSDPASILDWQSRLSVYRPATDGELQASQVAIETAATTEAGAVAVVGQLSRRFVDEHQPQLTIGGLESRELAAAREALTRALAAEDVARRGLDSLVREHFEGLRRLEDNSTRLEEAHARLAPRGQAPMPLTPVPSQIENPAWTKLSEQIRELDEHRDEMLLKMTEAHPLVVDVVGDLQALRAKLAELPRYLAESSLAPQRVAVSPAADPPAFEDAAAVVATAKTLAGERGKMRAALERYEAAKNHRLETQASVEVLERSPLLAAGPERYAIVESARVVARIPAISPLVRVGWLAAISSGVLLAMLWLLRPQPVIKVLRTAEDVATLLELPVIAHLRFPATRAAS